jgi:hypothetical protein
MTAASQADLIAIRAVTPARNVVAITTIGYDRCLVAWHRADRAIRIYPLPPDRHSLYATARIAMEAIVDLVRESREKRYSDDDYVPAGWIDPVCAEAAARAEELWQGIYNGTDEACEYAAVDLATLNQADLAAVMDALAGATP